MFIGRTDAEAPILWPPDAKSQLIGKDSDAGKDWGQEKGVTEDEMASLTQWTRVWANSGRWWRTGKPSVLQSMGSQRVGHDWATEQQQPNFLILLAVSLEQWLKYCGLRVKSNLLAVFTNKVLLLHKHTHSSRYFPWWLLCYSSMWSSCNRSYNAGGKKLLPGSLQICLLILDTWSCEARVKSQR